ncbi:CRISPR-associated endonuclease Cas3'' [Roseofilum sp. BLCC_M91]|uniref:CRISPR-associated endonuclease Cas3 n=1 Tax=Roseofilum halophilum BLCC-M91 TaxID=3022259 RepID=A0ABT7BPM6_9CYAN|nr:CRISPR-associated endonuclease Cas3'' [Roseofilum halophilum]MDJ1181134.1 CRISPR-associated endonuclease Cas3'' [Roseofilum halophilum BLCC-M91]
MKEPIARPGQTLKTHLSNVSDRLLSLLPEPYRPLSSAGLLHDVAKASTGWQHYLQEKVEGKDPKMVTHAAESAMAAAMISGWNRKNPPLIAYAIAAHHSQLKYRKNSEWFKTQKQRDADPELKDMILESMAWFRQSYGEFNIPGHLNLESSEKDVAIRMLTALLVDSDRLDAHCFSGGTVAIEAPPRSPQIVLPTRSTAIDSIRNRFREAICVETGHPFYRLTGPCGVGKTKAIMEVCDRLQAEKIIYVAPLKSILKQSADEFRVAYGAENILEHHSGYDPQEHQDWQIWKAQTERWELPVIVTSGVQFYESLLSNRASKLRKLRALINAVVVLDEVQTLPTQACKSILAILDQLTQHWGLKVILCSATQPKFEFCPRAASAPELVPLEVVAWCRGQMRNREYEWVGDLDWQAIGEQIDRSTLIGVNTRKAAQNCYYALLAQGIKALHLSSAMCPLHREQVVKAARQQLHRGQLCVLIATQVIESGIDISFPQAFKMMAPLDSIIQFGGRVNRAGEYPGAKVFLFDHGENLHSPEYAQAINVTRDLLQAYDDPFWDDHDLAIRDYYQQKFGFEGVNLEKLRLDLNFPEVAKFRCIDDNQITGYVQWGGGKRLIEALQEKIKNKEYLTLGDWKQLAQYAISVPQSQARHVQVEDGLRVWSGDYDEAIGAVLVDHD